MDLTEAFQHFDTDGSGFLDSAYFTRQLEHFLCRLSVTHRLFPSLSRPVCVTSRREEVSLSSLGMILFKCRIKPEESEPASGRLPSGGKRSGSMCSSAVDIISSGPEETAYCNYTDSQ